MAKKKMTKGKKKIAKIMTDFSKGMLKSRPETGLKGARLPKKKK